MILLNMAFVLITGVTHSFICDNWERLLCPPDKVEVPNKASIFPSLATKQTLFKTNFSLKLLLKFSTSTALAIVNPRYLKLHWLNSFQDLN